MNERDKVYLKHILDAIGDIKSYTFHYDEEKFQSNKMVQDAVIRNLEIIGEATKNLSLSFRKMHKNVEWKRIAGMRDILIHDYLGVDIDKVWAVVQNKLPDLKKKIQRLLKLVKGNR